MITQEYKIASELLIPAADKFGNVPQKIHWLTQMKTTDDINTINVVFINAKTKEEIPAAIEEDKQLVMQAIEQSTDEVVTKKLNAQLTWITNIQDMIVQPVYNKEPDNELMTIVSKNMSKEFKPKDVYLLSGLSHYNEVQ